MKLLVLVSVDTDQGMLSFIIIFLVWSIRKASVKSLSPCLHLPILGTDTSLRKYV